MTQYIDKDALVAEIEKLQLCTMDEHMNYYSTEAQGEYNALSKLRSFLDTLEMKEVDLETHGKELMYAIQKTGERTKREIISKACEYLSETLMDNRDNCGYNVVSSFDTITLSEYIENFKKVMGE